MNKISSRFCSLLHLSFDSNTLECKSLLLCIGCALDAISVMLYWGISCSMMIVEFDLTSFPFPSSLLSVIKSAKYIVLKCIPLPLLHCSTFLEEARLQRL